MSGPVAVIDLSRERARRGLAIEPWITKQQVARHYGVSTKTVERWMNDPRYRRGGRQAPHRRVFGGPAKFQLVQLELWMEDPRDV